MAPTMDVRNFTTVEEMGRIQGPVRSFLNVLFPMTTVIALLGNFVAIIVLKCGKKTTELRYFLINLSLADISMALFSTPFTFSHFVNGQWKYPAKLCPFVQMMQLTSVFVSIYTLVAISIERYIAIWHPFLFSQIHHHFQVVVLVIIWTLGLGLGSVQLLNTAAIPFRLNNDDGEIYHDCVELWDPTELRILTMTIFLVLFGFPLLVLYVTYGLIAYKIYTHYPPGETNEVQSRLQRKMKVKIFRMMAIIVLLFNICWLPLQTWNVLIYFDWMPTWMIEKFSTKEGFQTYVLATVGIHWLAMANSFVNPFVYYFMSNNFLTDYRYLRFRMNTWFSKYRKQPRNERVVEIPMVEMQARKESSPNKVKKSKSHSKRKSKKSKEKRSRNTDSNSKRHHSLPEISSGIPDNLSLSYDESSRANTHPQTTPIKHVVVVAELSVDNNSIRGVSKITNVVVSKQSDSC